MLQCLECGWFVLDAHQAVVDVQLACPCFCGTAIATAEQRQFDPGLLQQFQAEPIANIEAFLEPTCRIKPEASIGQHAIHIQHQKLQLGQWARQLLPVPFPQQSSHSDRTFV